MKQSLLEFLDKFPKKDCQTFDIGNSHPHAGSFQNGTLKEVSPFSLSDIDQLANGQNKIVCSVSKKVASSAIFQNFGESFKGMPVHYSATLGHDRLALASLAYHWLQKEVIIIDAGTFITVDCVSLDGFIGGYIIPGITTLLKTYQNGEQLFTAQLETSNNQQWPKNTQEAISCGSKLLVDALFEKIATLTNNKSVILTGGSADLLAPYLKPAFIEPHLIHYSLYFQYVS
ncbi:MAG: type III pantothenate kinase [Bacteriovoracaceae bacterium]|nr:type III pantothenate kinase [Bacteriovoracaceae bacterium]